MNRRQFFGLAATSATGLRAAETKIMLPSDQPDEHGFRLIYEPRAMAEHLHPQTLRDWQQRVWRIAASER